MSTIRPPWCLRSPGQSHTLMERSSLPTNPATASPAPMLPCDSGDIMAIGSANIVGMQSVTNGLRVARYDGKIGFRRRVRFFASLFPIAQSPERNMKPRCKLFLTEPESTADDAHLWCAFHAFDVIGGYGLCVSIAPRGPVALLFGHRIKSLPVMLIGDFLHGIFVSHRVQPHGLR